MRYSVLFFLCTLFFSVSAQGTKEGTIISLKNIPNKVYYSTSYDVVIPSCIIKDITNLDCFYNEAVYKSMKFSNKNKYKADKYGNSPKEEILDREFRITGPMKHKDGWYFEMERADDGQKMAMFLPSLDNTKIDRHSFLSLFYTPNYTVIKKPLHAIIHAGLNYALDFYDMEQIRSYVNDLNKKGSGDTNKKDISDYIATPQNTIPLPSIGKCEYLVSNADGIFAEFVNNGNYQYYSCDSLISVSKRLEKEAKELALKPYYDKYLGKEYYWDGTIYTKFRLTKVCIIGMRFDNENNPSTCVVKFKSENGFIDEKLFSVDNNKKQLDRTFPIYFKDKSVEERYSFLSKEDFEQIRNGNISIGTNAFVVSLILGLPNDINTTETMNGTHEQWIYPNGKYYYFDDGKLTVIQNFGN